MEVAADIIRGAAAVATDGAAVKMEADVVTGGVFILEVVRLGLLKLISPEPAEDMMLLKDPNVMFGALLPLFGPLML